MGNQLSLRIAKRPPPNGTWWGGRRKGAGRKPTGLRAGSSHAARSSGPRFDGWSIELPDMTPPDDGWLPSRRARSWLLRAGWKLAGPISPWDRPGPLDR